jgi:Cu2+-containing amine oxidase
MGGELNPNCRETAHVHNFYFRIDLDIDGAYPNDVCEVFDHNTYDLTGDKWVLVTKQGKLLADTNKARKWRVRNTKATNAAGELKAYEIEVPQYSFHDKYSTGDVWVTVYRGDSVQQGEKIGASGCSDKELETDYAVGPLDTIDGSDIVLWVCVRSHHEPRAKSEEAVFLPYHYAEFTITPRSFELFREQRTG